MAKQERAGFEPVQNVDVPSWDDGEYESDDAAGGDETPTEDTDDADQVDGQDAEEGDAEGDPGDSDEPGDDPGEDDQPTEDTRETRREERRTRRVRELERKFQSAEEELKRIRPAAEMATRLWSEISNSWNDDPVECVRELVCQVVGDDPEKVRKALEDLNEGLGIELLDLSMKGLRPETAAELGSKKIQRQFRRDQARLERQRADLRKAEEQDRQRRGLEDDRRVVASAIESISSEVPHLVRHELLPDPVDVVYEMALEVLRSGKKVDLPALVRRADATFRTHLLKLEGIVKSIPKKDGQRKAGEQGDATRRATKRKGITNARTSGAATRTGRDRTDTSDRDSFFEGRRTPRGRWTPGGWDD